MPYSNAINTFRLSLVLLGFITLVACGDIEEAALPSSAPIANAGTDQTPLLGDTVTLDGSASSDVDGDLLTYSWSFISKPVLSTAKLSDPAAVKPTFVMDLYGDYVVQLIVSDVTMDSAPDTVIISTNNSAPVANAGADETKLFGDTVILDGSASSDVDGDLLTYSWSFISKPAGSMAALSDSTAMQPIFAIDVLGDYVVQLIVNDTMVDSAPDAVTISANNTAPVANAGADETKLFGDTVLLDGSASSDVDGDGLTYSWSFTSKPAGSTAALSDSTAVQPIFAIDVSGDYVVQLIVNDGLLNSAPDTVTISTSNSAPVADAGENQEPQVGDTVKLDGSASSDVDGDELKYRWSFLLVPPGSMAILSNPTVVDPTFEMDLPGDYVVQLIVNDGTVDSVADTMVVTTN